MSVERLARRLLERRPRHRVVSLYLDLDPEEFATPPARESQVHSLLDGVGHEVEADETLDHEDLIALREDLGRLRTYLTSDEPPFQGARALAVFASGRDELFEVIQLHQPVAGRVVVGGAPYIEPLVEAAQARRWCVALVSERNARIFTGMPFSLQERERIGLREQFEEEDAHLRDVAGRLERLWLDERFDLLAVGGETRGRAAVRAAVEPGPAPAAGRPAGRGRHQLRQRRSGAGGGEPGRRAGGGASTNVRRSIGSRRDWDRAAALSAGRRRPSRH